MSQELGLIIYSLLTFFFLVGGSFTLLYLKRNRLNLRDSLKIASVSSDLKYSLVSILIFTASYYFILKSAQFGLNKLYVEFSDGGIKQFLLSFVFLIVGYDAYFYWSHRILHQSWLYKNVHRIHHNSRHPTPFSAMAFHPIEAIMQALYLPFMAFVIPTHVSFLVVAPTFIMILSIVGHLGFEFLPKKFRLGVLGKHFGSSTHHHLHHLYPNTNFGFLFMIWDQVVGTKKGVNSVANFTRIVERNKVNSLPQVNNR